MNPAQLTQSLQTEARNAEFDFWGFCPAVQPAGLGRLEKWLESGFDGEMHYIRERRDAYAHPNGVMDGVRSIMMLGMNYRNTAPVTEIPGTGRLASYAWGVDYHDLIHKRLKALCKSLRESYPEIGVRGVIDTAPLLEREFAQLAGLGWHAKNTMLINRDHGSWFFLAALLIDRETEYDLPMETSHCGTCTACLDACPTDAFAEPGVLNANRCISYLTIEHRSPIAQELRPMMGQWLLGCDVCQEVCPWNNKSSHTDKAQFQPAPGHNPLDLIPLFDLDDDAFRARFRKTPMWRPRRRGLLRNAALILGNHPCDRAAAALARGLNDCEALIRGACAWALARQENRTGSERLLRERLLRETDEIVVHEIETALQWLARP